VYVPSFSFLAYVWRWYRNELGDFYFAWLFLNENQFHMALVVHTFKDNRFMHPSMAMVRTFHFFKELVWKVLKKKTKLSIL
jgi:hypothetical protein